jgi:hypothetical protein
MKTVRFLRGLLLAALAAGIVSALNHSRSASTDLHHGENTVRS